MNHRYFTYLIISGTLFFLSASLYFAPESSIIPGFEDKLENYYQKYPQQKAYLHLDKLSYTAGEKLWYMAYLLDARTHKPDTISKNLVVELVNSYGNVSLIQLLNVQRGYARGDFHLPDTLPEGLYQIRAYTNWMRNFGPEYFFTREVNVWNPGNYINLYREDKLASKKHKRKSSKKARDIDLQFFPEGGYMIDGINTRIGFKAINQLGLGVDVSGKILSGKGNTVAEFESSHLGMGSFEFRPEEGAKYTAEIMNSDGKTEKFKLPEVQGSGYYMKLAEKGNGIIKLQLGSTFDNPLVLVACHVRGNLLFTSELRLNPAGSTLEIPTSDFPGGLVHITLFDSNREPRCERLVFVHSDEIINISLSQDKNQYSKYEPVEITLTARDSEGKPVSDRFSLSVSDRDLQNNASDFQSGIIANLMLSSDIKGRIENPDYYFNNRNAETLEALDLLLLTQGWRRFNWSDIINGTPMDINYPIQSGLIVRGKVTKEFLEIPLKNLPVTLTVLSEFNDVFIDRSNDKGEFEFELPDYEDTIQIEITARRLNGKKNLVIYLEESEMEDPDKIYSTYASEMVVRGTNVLRPVEEVAEDTMAPKLTGIHTPDYVLYVDDNMRAQGSVLEMMQGRIPGVVVSGNSVLIRGPTSFVQSNEPLYLIDNIPTDVSAVQSINPNDVERIEVLKGPSAAIYGVRGANGVIAIYTLRGRYMIKGVLKFDMLGYHRAAEFYSPKYGTEFDDMVIDTRSSLYWDPEVRTDGTGTARILFYNSDKLSRFYVVAQGVTSEGQIGQAERSYLVSE